MTLPMEAVSATEEPDTPAKNVEATTFTTASPPLMKPTSTVARLTRRVAMPPSAMMAPASTKKGMASSEKSSVPSEIFSITASSGMSTQKAAMRLASPSVYATGMPMAHRMAKAPSSTMASMVGLLEGRRLVPVHDRGAGRLADPHALDDEEQGQKARRGAAGRYVTPTERRGNSAIT